MSYGEMVCGKCRGEVRTYDGHGGTCPNCGQWVSAGTADTRVSEIPEREVLEMKAHRIWLEKVRDAERRGTLRVVTYCEEDDDDRTYRYRHEYSTLDEALSRSYHGLYCYDGDRKIEMPDPEDLRNE